ncbi:peptide deformylase [Nesterenkonia aerolata]|uniref:Peptide deformylase n=1 Tax=Nesterenkonia aerolata TaxID=3074079 RepID=A0ABU2DQ88_9MICC|nr:peptide deformylase [Nesterenkonia sp. LY-0111]MDR8018664.1 peptide deformylase [Nesterenkonia sp. LY-0111]
MTIRPITICGEPVLHQRAAEVETIDDEIRTLIDDMFATMDAAHGVGLAAPQIGVGRRIFTYQYADSGEVPSRGVIINPRLRLIAKPAQTAPDAEEHTEGCLSVPGLGFPLHRSDHVEVMGIGLDGAPIRFEARGWFARIMQHEYDHLDGFLYVDRLNPQWTRRWRRARRREGWGVPGLSWMPGEDPDPFGHDEDSAEEPGTVSDAQR